MSRTCACQRLDEIESKLIRTRAWLLQIQREVALMKLETAGTQSLSATAASQDGVVPLALLERQAIESAVRQLGIAAACAALGISKTNIYLKLRGYGWRRRGVESEEA
ncbi:MAG: hypothetical protein WCA44_17995 [Acidobacteriaceae bacterium]